MKISLVGISAVPLGKFNVKDPRLDQVHKLVAADKRTYVQVDLVGEDQAGDADAILVSSDARADVILKDWEFVETRLSRSPGEAEAAVLAKLKEALEKERFAFEAGLSAEEKKIVSVYNLLTLRPVSAASQAELEKPETLILKLLHESGFICFLTVGGKENRAWLIRKGSTAWEAASAIHSDLQKGFIRAEIIGYDDFIQAGGETQAKRAGKMRLEQKEYVMQDCDITNFRVNK
jgi:ribosome-binding ATPase YchF (GTP1/OBG family)